MCAMLAKLVAVFKRRTLDGWRQVDLIRTRLDQPHPSNIPLWAEAPSWRQRAEALARETTPLEKHDPPCVVMLLAMIVVAKGEAKGLAAAESVLECMGVPLVDRNAMLGCAAFDAVAVSVQTWWESIKVRGVSLALHATQWTSMASWWVACS